MNLYEVLFYSGEEMPPAYYLIDGIEGEKAEDALRDHLEEIVNKIRQIFGLGDDFPDRKIYDGLYVLREGGLVSARTLA